MNRIGNRILSASAGIVFRSRRLNIISARSNCTESREQQNIALSKLLQKADKAPSSNLQLKYLQEAVELGEKLELQAGHLATLYGMTANACYNAEKNDLAEKYFLICINRYVNSGGAPESPTIIEISLKLSNIYKSNSEFAKAESGYKWCVDVSKKLVEVNNMEKERKNLQAMYGISLDAYSRFLFEVGKFNEALPIIQESIQVAEKIDADGVQIQTLKINFSSVLAEAERYDESIDVLNEVIRETRNTKLEIDALLNKGLLFQEKMNRKDEAVTVIKEAIKAALEQDDPQNLLKVKKMAKEYNINFS